MSKAAAASASDALEFANIDPPLFKRGQKHPTPSPGAGDRVFYESLFVERPDSEMALIWCIEHGVFPEDKDFDDRFAEYERVKSKPKAKGATSVAATASPAKKPSKSAGGVKAPKSSIVDTSAIPYDAGTTVGGSEGIGTMTF